jgi:carbon starvation protein
MTAGIEKIFSAMPNVGFLSHAAKLAAEAALTTTSAERGAEIARLIWNDRIDAAMTGFFIAAVVVILGDSIRVWSKLLLGNPERALREEAA